MDEFDEFYQDVANDPTAIYPIRASELLLILDRLKSMERFMENFHSDGSRVSRNEDQSEW